ncbi:MAG: S-layer family protein [Acaryochloridaceae cyanobacterium SU_2_1]|nr:S-layer family protein [Acaryochloridaceae cyanobacterium SU_2_1]
MLIAPRVFLTNGARLLAGIESGGQGRGGDITVMATDALTISGFSEDGRLQSGLLTTSAADSIGPPGKIIVETGSLRISDGGILSTQSFNDSNGGDVDLKAGTLILDRGSITAGAEQNGAGAIRLDIDNLLLLRNGSEISTNANGDGTGGDIEIKAPLILAFPQENSDIEANAQNGPGGKINITTTAIFGLEVRSTDTELSDITAVSQNTDLDGQVEINTPETNPSENLSEQPEIVPPPTEIAQGCRAGQALNNSSFISLGRGGLPLSPQELQTAPALWQDLRASQLQESEQVSSVTLPTSVPPTPAAAAAIVEAKGWTQDPEGRIYLSAQAPEQTAYHPWQPSAAC